MGERDEAGLWEVPDPLEVPRDVDRSYWDEPRSRNDDRPRGSSLAGPLG